MSFIALMAAGVAMTGTAAIAASLQVSPVNIIVDAPAAAATLTLRNTGARPFTAQVRVFRWTQQNGRDVLQPTSDVVASPPAMQLIPGQDYTVRIVRPGGGTLVQEEAYRVVVDELPPPAHKARAVNMVVRHNIPAFFTPRSVSGATVNWSISGSGRNMVLQGQNRGDGYLRAGVTQIRDAAGKTATVSNGLTGYILPGSTMRWPVRTVQSGFTGRGLKLEVGTQNGPQSIALSARGAK